MTLLFAILILSTLAVVCVGIAIFLRIRRHMRDDSLIEPQENANDLERGQETGSL
jgi:hypothetical protein